MTIDTDNARNQAKAKVENIISMMERLEHIRECDYGGSWLTCMKSFTEVHKDLITMDITIEDAEQIELYHDEDEAQQAIDEYILDVSYRSGWQSGTASDGLEAEEYMISLSTGGPATRITGDLNTYNEPASAIIECQDWSTPWTEYVIPYEQREILKQFASHFVF